MCYKWTSKDMTLFYVNYKKDQLLFYPRMLLAETDHTFIFDWLDI